VRLPAARRVAWVAEQSRRGGMGPGRVHSVFARVANLAWRGGTMLSLAGSEVPLAPNGVQVTLTPGITMLALGLAPGQPAWWQADRIDLPGAGLTLGLSGATVWDARFAPAGGLTAARLARGVRELRRVVLDAAPEAPLTALLGPAAPGPPGSPLVSRLRGPLHDLVLGAVLGEPGRVAAAAREIAGLGPGLTPSGDDVLIGFLAGLVPGGLAVGLAAGHRHVVTALVGAAGPRMSVLGRVWLHHAARGEVAEPLHRLLGAMLGPSPAALAPAAAPLLALGATSGPDLAVGLLAGLDALARALDARSRTASWRVVGARR
jgi:hypothetical protein